MNKYSARFKFANELINDCKNKLKDLTIDVIEEKADNKDLVTNIDKDINQYIISSITNRYKDEVIGEELSHNGNPANKWFIDPIDGTTNFIYRNRDFAISIAYVSSEEKFGLVYDVKEDKLYSAHTEYGAFINGEKFTRPKTPEYGIVHVTPSDLREEVYYNFSEKFIGVRYLEVCAIEIVRVAIGEASCFIRKNQEVWDYMAAVIFSEVLGLNVEIKNGRDVLVGTPL